MATNHLPPEGSLPLHPPSPTTADILETIYDLTTFDSIFSLETTLDAFNFLRAIFSLQPDANRALTKARNCIARLKARREELLAAIANTRPDLTIPIMFNSVNAADPAAVAMALAHYTSLVRTLQSQLEQQQPGDLQIIADLHAANQCRKALVEMQKTPVVAAPPAPAQAPPPIPHTNPFIVHPPTAPKAMLQSTAPQQPHRFRIKVPKTDENGTIMRDENGVVIMVRKRRRLRGTTHVR